MTKCLILMFLWSVGASNVAERTDAARVQRDGHWDGGRRFPEPVARVSWAC